MTEEELKQIEDRVALPHGLAMSGLELQLRADIKVLLAEVRSLKQGRKPPYQTGA